MATDSIPMPPEELRRIVGPINPADFDNPTREPLLSGFGLSSDETYSSVFDFGCGCGRQARQLLLQGTRPQRYVGIDVHPGLIAWCRDHLTPVDSAFTFVHHNVYSPWYAPDNAMRLSQPFPVEDSAFSLVLANSVFTHLMREQAEYYLTEVARILSPRGVAYTSWLFFDRTSFPFLEHVYALHTSPINFGQAALFDREWFLETVHSIGLGVQRTVPPPIAGHQWNVLLVKRTGGMVDDFPLGDEAAEWLCGATSKAMAKPASLPTDLEAKLIPPAPVYVQTEKPRPPALFGYLARADELQQTLDAMTRSKAWTIGRTLTAPARLLRRFF